MNIDDLNAAAAARDFLVICQKLHPDYANYYPADDLPDFSMDEVRCAAENADCISELERDVALAPLALAHRRAVQDYATSNPGKKLLINEMLELSIVRKSGKKDYEQRVASAFIVTGEGYNSSNVGSCLSILVKNTKGSWKELFVPRGELAKGTDVHARLGDAGLLVGHWLTLLHFLQNIVPAYQFVRIENAGWNDDYYALPSGEVLPADDTATATFAPVANFVVQGSVEGSEELMLAVEQQSRFVFAAAAVSASFLLAHFGPEAEPGGFHFSGPSSRGKTTLLQAAASIWGIGAEVKDGGIVGSWNTTSFAAEQTAAQHSDNALFLDELKAADPKNFSQLIMQLANGAGRKAGTSSGALRAMKTFRPMYISSGEISAKDYITSNNLPYHGGMAVRLIDIPADTGSGFGIFDSVPPHFNGDAGAFSRWIKQTSASHCGHYGRALVNHYLGDRAAFLNEMKLASASMRALLDEAGGNSDPQTGRVSDRFAFVGAAAVVACQRGVLPWQPESVRKSIMSVFQAWFDTRGGAGSQEGLAAEKAFSAFIYAKRERFQEHAGVRDRDRVGMVQRFKDTRRLEVWVPNDDALAEILGEQAERIVPFLERIKDGLSEEWELIVSEKGRNKRDAPKGFELPSRCYCIRSKVDMVHVAANDDIVGDMQETG